MAYVRSNTWERMRVMSNIAIETAVDLKSFERKTEHRWAPTEKLWIFETRVPGYLKFIKVSFDSLLGTKLNGVADSALDSEAYFMTSVGSNLMKTKNSFLSFLVLNDQFFVLFYICQAVLNGFKWKSEFFHPRAADIS